MELIHEFTADRQKMGEEKGESYANSDTDRLKNFRALSEELGTSMEQQLATYLLKHIRAINHWIKMGSVPDGDLDVRSDGIVGRIADAENYLDLLYVMIREKMAPRIRAADPTPLHRPAPGSLPETDTALSDS